MLRQQRVLGSAWVWESSWSPSAAPSFLPAEDRPWCSPPSPGQLQPGASAAALWPCSRPAQPCQQMGKAQSSGDGGWEEDRDGDSYTLSFTCLALQLLAQPHLPSPPGSRALCGPVPGENKCPSSPSKGAAGWEGGGTGAVGEMRTPLSPSHGQERTPPSLLRQVLAQGGSATLAMGGLKAPSPHCTLKMYRGGPLSFVPFLQEQEWWEVLLSLGSSIAASSQGHMVPAPLQPCGELRYGWGGSCMARGEQRRAPASAGWDRGGNRLLQD